MIDIRLAAARFETVRPGVTTRHCFSSGVHYEPDNTAFGPVLAVDEHVLAPGAGFGRHAHRGVEIVSWVLAGSLRHEESSGRTELVAPGTALCQSTGSGIVHVERNASDAHLLHFVQMMVMGEITPPDHLLGAPPLRVGGGDFAVLCPVPPVELAAAAYLHLFVTNGRVSAAGRRLQTGDSARVRDQALTVAGRGQVLVWRSVEPRSAGHLTRGRPGGTEVET
ncbi:MAG: pirin family protein [Jatrophihabitantaceae bacterium]